MFRLTLPARAAGRSRTGSRDGGGEDPARRGRGAHPRGAQGAPRAEGYRVVAVETRDEGIAALAGAPDLVILDRRLPDGEGLDVLARAPRVGARRHAA